jgi:hypothetical protein
MRIDQLSIVELLTILRTMRNSPDGFVSLDEMVQFGRNNVHLKKILV